ncbi:MAG: thiamine-phosphate kinase [Candidatus Omnitrophica bacterium CG12_big_fil_rev_8_21_14_0_65_43_15]|uniref:Thiamine-monophosphate kinase n=1 Tax=Candidatus Taenaricola geysiri TaxID=1974752 RepID=A0A2J0LMH9_9BACT|nr:MAG: thiamine-phosphate kinase [Candidatus Omnitrophica bacterium CG1_02_43_210]PIR66069.1 MAG: thiamine-phosphate kinase [Candidatus Omnitrophica bacterium CG10_big_fil_rev_8_21_14_0_10_43_8]PIV12202.1 MAG: thiamine-phosphate kinase [Candidatus Omnitrophica bacterium CG03_land_8_20_14_0_80_43_22]PIW65916.1 MAG: thiamine-phosphate kinase [Candidatus Omnitrophica bacterium CG12_big_fil_rev_8_21_14_0_65_43_15]PIW80543.1 MAG: thiamine-phosphate kinase [Candidatus Omnitrophica bacterium CG_4_8_1
MKSGEFTLINRLTKDIKTDKSVIIGVGDDAAVLEFNKKEYLLLTCDMLIEDVHFLRKTSPQDIGQKAVCCSVSDIAAMGGEPKWMVVSAGIPKNIKTAYIDGIYSGIKKAAAKFNVNITGGDTVSSDKIVIDISMAGVVKKNNLTLRSGAKLGDAIFVTGALGNSYKTGKHLKFTPRIKEAQALVNNFKINSMMDISDGLSGDLWHILERSKLGAVVYEKYLPKSKSATLDAALSEGEDFELLFTVSKRQARRIIEKFPLLCKTPITCIGEIIKSGFGFVLIDKNKKPLQIKPKGYDHFA